MCIYRLDISCPAGSASAAATAAVLHELRGHSASLRCPWSQWSSGLNGRGIFWGPKRDAPIGARSGYGAEASLLIRLEHRGVRATIRATH